MRQFENIEDEALYYERILLVPSTSQHFVCTAHLTTCSDAARYQGVGPQSYVTIFQVLSYDASKNLLPIVFAHSVASESAKTWTSAYQACRGIEGFDIPKRVCMVNQEKSIDSSVTDVFTHASIFSDKLYVAKNMPSLLGKEKTSGFKLYKKALQALSKSTVDVVKAQYGPKTSAYLSEFKKEEIIERIQN